VFPFIFLPKTSTTKGTERKLKEKAINHGERQERKAISTTNTTKNKKEPVIPANAGIQFMTFGPKGREFKNGARASRPLRLFCGQDVRAPFSSSTSWLLPPRGFAASHLPQEEG
jgi:hypothetical protein